MWYEILVGFFALCAMAELQQRLVINFIIQPGMSVEQQHRALGRVGAFVAVSEEAWRYGCLALVGPAAAWAFTASIVIAETVQYNRMYCEHVRSQNLFVSRKTLIMGSLLFNLPVRSIPAAMHVAACLLIVNFGPVGFVLATAMHMALNRAGATDLADRIGDALHRVYVRYGIMK